MMSRRRNKWYFGLCALAAVLLAATWALAIGKAERPRPKDVPMAMGEQIPQAEVGEKPERAAERGGTGPKSGAAKRPPTAAEMIEAEERKHLRRMARINRIQVVGIESEDQGLVDLARELRDAETERHELAMKRLERALKGGGER
jgi:hypothetical protein